MHPNSLRNLKRTASPGRTPGLSIRYAASWPTYTVGVSTSRLLHRPQRLCSSQHSPPRPLHCPPRRGLPGRAAEDRVRDADWEGVRAPVTAGVVVSGETVRPPGRVAQLLFERPLPL